VIGRFAVEDRNLICDRWSRDAELPVASTAIANVVEQ
jgi:hypothetical protein